MKNIKKILVSVIALTMVFTLAACGGNDNGSSEEGKNFASAEELLTEVYNNFGEDYQFPAAGGSSDAMSEEGPGAFTVGDGTELNQSMHFPMDYVGDIEEAATMFHLMNANTFAAGAYKINGDINEVAEAFTDEIDNTQWICGFPEVFVVIKAGDYMVSAFGDSEIMDEFVKQVEANVANTEVIVNHPISE